MSRLTLSLLWLILIGACMASLWMGPAELAPIASLIDWARGSSTPEALIMGEIRLPRLLLAVTVGAALGLSGAALQALLRNPLADPSLTGASQGAALGAATVFYFGFFPMLGPVAPALAGLLGALLAMVLMLGLAGTSGASTVLLAGLALSSVSGAALAAVLNYAPNPFAMQELVFWLLGSVSERGLDHLLIIGPALGIAGVLLARERGFLAALSLGEEVARSLGFQFARHAWLVVFASALLVGAAVAVAGGIGFVGLVVPHLVRPLVGHRPDRGLLPSALVGATVVCLADLLVRMSPAGRELKLGVLTALIGAPLLIALIWKERQRWR